MSTGDIIFLSFVFVTKGLGKDCSVWLGHPLNDGRDSLSGEQSTYLQLLHEATPR